MKQNNEQEAGQLALITEERGLFHDSLLAQNILKLNQNGVASNADKDSKTSVAIAKGIAERLGTEQKRRRRLAGQSSGSKFENACKDFVERTFTRLGHLRPGQWTVEQVVSRKRLTIANYEQYSHLLELKEAADENPHLAAIISGYTIAPDLVVLREPEGDAGINSGGLLVDDVYTQMSVLRRSNNPKPILHASISCKWTMRSDRAQNTRTEALNLLRNRKGRAPHIVAIVGEPLPSRIASIAIGTGDIDCTYHFALRELRETLEELDYEDAQELVEIMVLGKRLKDISDLPLDLAV